MKRKTYKQFSNFRKIKTKNSILLGFRQASKTWIKQHLGEKEYKTCTQRLQDSTCPFPGPIHQRQPRA